MEKRESGVVLFNILSRRRLLQMGLTLGALAGPIVGARGQKPYPSRAVHVIFGFAAGGSSDVFGRLMCQWLYAKLGEPFLFENRPGANGNIATEAVLRAPPDGHTLLWCNSANTINATFYHNFDFAPVAGVFRVPHVLEVHPSVPVEVRDDCRPPASRHRPVDPRFAEAGLLAEQQRDHRVREV